MGIEDDRFKNLLPDHDPTAFEIDFDPTVQRMKGIAMHGHTPFDV